MGESSTLRLTSPRSSPEWVTVLCSWARLNFHNASFHPGDTQIPANYQGSLMKSWGLTCNRLVSYPGRRGNTPSYFMQWKLR